MRRVRNGPDAARAENALQWEQPSRARPCGTAAARGVGGRCIAGPSIEAVVVFRRRPPELELFAVFTWLDPPYDPRAVQCVLCVPCGGPGIRNDARTNPAEGLAVLPRIRLPSSRGEPGSGPGSRRSGEVGSGRRSPLPRSRSRSRALSGARVSDAAGSDSARRGREFAASVVAVQR